MRKSDPWLPPVFTRADATRAGMTKSQLDTRVTNGTWRPLSRGSYCLRGEWEAADSAKRQAMIVTGALATVTYPAFASHASAAALLGLPVPNRGPGWITRLPPASTRYSDDLTVEVASVPIADQWSVRGLPCTSLRRTVADCLRHLRPPDSLAVADGAERDHPGVIEGVRLVLEQCSDWPYAATGATVLPLVDGRRESPLESWSFWYLHEFRVPMPEPQVDLYDELGRFLGRADAWWDLFGVAGEADGRTKYDGLAGGSLAAAKQAVYDEKRREDALRAAGAGVIRWGAADLSRPAAWARDIERRLTSHGPSRFRGRAVPSRRVA